MLNLHKPFIIHNYFEIFLRRIWYIVIPFVIIAAGTVTFLIVAPKTYRSTTLVLVTPQKVPENFIKSTITSDIQDRLQSISQEILSRTRLEQLIGEFKLYPEETKSFPMERVVEIMRKDIRFEIRTREGQTRDGSGGHFTISYIGQDPNQVTAVANKLASLFIEENLKLREQQAQGTVDFLTSELATTKQKMDEQEKTLTGFKKQHLNELPEQREANMRVLEQLQTNSQRINDSLKSAEDRKLIIQNRLADIELQGSSSIYAGPLRQGRSEVVLTPTLSPPENQLAQLKAQLVELQTRYTDSYPDIISTKKKIVDLERKIKENAAKKEKGEGTDDRQISIYYKEMKSQLIPIDLEIKRLRDEDVKNRAMIVNYRARIENTPLREVAISQILQDYTQTKEAYQNLLRKKEDAQQSENLERRQKGEQFRIIDPARVPEKPFKPNIPQILLLGLLAGLGVGFGLGFLREQMDRSFRDGEDIETTLGYRVLANIPKIDVEAT